MKIHQIELTDPERAVPFLSDFLSGILEEISAPPEVENAMQLAAEEAVVNILNHGYKGSHGVIRVQCDVKDGLIRLCIEDDAPFFNPLTLPPPDVKTGLDERKIGGLGVYLIRSLMDTVSYSETSTGNRLVLEKSYSC